ncbi:MAG: glutathione S-transferase family protein [Hyphomicrobiaceae bacterium]|nr:glutathione S-transferase family protein [Hyphomicrobiaceae bacterium]
MILTGQLDSPFVRRVAVALNMYALPFEHNVISAYDDFGELLTLNPLGKVPALQLDDGTVLADSTLILDYLDHLVGEDKSLWPSDLIGRAKALSHVGVAVGLAEKAVEFRTETVRRPPGKVDQPRVDRVRAQIGASLDWLEQRSPGERFLGGDKLTHADIASAVAVTFIANKNPEHLADTSEAGRGKYPSLLAHMQRCEEMAEFKAAPFTDY